MTAVTKIEKNLLSTSLKPLGQFYYDYVYLYIQIYIYLNA